MRSKGPTGAWEGFDTVVLKERPDDTHVTSRGCAALQLGLHEFREGTMEVAKLFLVSFRHYLPFRQPLRREPLQCLAIFFIL